MDLADLRCFVAVVDHGGFNAAAKALYRAQPSVTRRIQNLEEGLGARLLERGRWGVALTRQGEVFYRGAKQILGAVADLKAETTGFMVELVRLGATAADIGGFLAGLLADWIPANPHVDLVVVEDGAKTMLHRIERRECEIGIVAAPVSPFFEHRFMKRVNVQALLPRSHRLAGSSSALSVTELHRERVLIMGEGFLSTELLLSTCELSGVEPEIVYESRVGQTLAALAEGGLGIAIMGDSVDLRGYGLPRRLITNPLGKLLTFELCLAWLKDRELSTAARDLVEKLAGR